MFSSIVTLGSDTEKKRHVFFSEHVFNFLIFFLKRRIHFFLELCEKKHNKILFVVFNIAQTIFFFF